MANNSSGLLNWWIKLVIIISATKFGQFKLKKNDKIIISFTGEMKLFSPMVFDNMTSACDLSGTWNCIWNNKGNKSGETRSARNASQLFDGALYLHTHIYIYIYYLLLLLAVGRIWERGMAKLEGSSFSVPFPSLFSRFRMVMSINECTIVYRIF